VKQHVTSLTSKFKTLRLSTKSTPPLQTWHLCETEYLSIATLDPGTSLTMAPDSSRQYELIVYGATGYTGKYTAEHLHETAPSDLKWAIAGRNAKKLEAIIAELQALNPSRPLPAVETIEHNQPGLDSLARKTKVLISTVGPYARYGTPVVEACIKAGTDYLDVTGEVPWVYDIIAKFHDKARKDGIVLIPQSGVDSVPSEIITYLLVKYAREHYQEGLGEVINSTQEMKYVLFLQSSEVIANMKTFRNGISGGTADSGLSITENFSISHLMKSMDPFGLSPVKPSAIQKQAVGGGGILSSILGYITVPELGNLTNWPGNSIDRAIVHRSWALFDDGELYGKSFHFAQLLKARNALQAVVQAMVMRSLPILLALPPGRWLLRKMVPSPGDGPSREQTNKMSARYKALAITESGKKITGELVLKGSMYYWTGVFVAEAALELLRGSGGKAKRECGVMTPSTLEAGYIERLAKAGFNVQVKALL